jgi:hypothetical protein
MFALCTGTEVCKRMKVCIGYVSYAVGCTRRMESGGDKA